MRLEHKTNHIYGGKRKSLKFADKINKNLYKLAGGREVRVISNDDGSVGVQEKKYKLNSIASKIKTILLFILTLPLLAITMPIKLASSENRAAAKQFAQIKLERETLEKRRVSDKENEILKAQQEANRRAEEAEQRARAIRLLQSPVKGQTPTRTSTEVKSLEDNYNPFTEPAPFRQPALLWDPFDAPANTPNQNLPQEVQKTEEVANQNWFSQSMTALSTAASDATNRAVKSVKGFLATSTPASSETPTAKKVSTVREKWDSFAATASTTLNTTWEKAKSLAGYGPEKKEEDKAPAVKVEDMWPKFSKAPQTTSNVGLVAGSSMWPTFTPTQQVAVKTDRVAGIDMWPKFYTAPPVPQVDHGLEIDKLIAQLDSPAKGSQKKTEAVAKQSTWASLTTSVSEGFKSGVSTVRSLLSTKPAEERDPFEELPKMIADLERFAEQKQKEAAKTEAVAQPSWVAAKTETLRKKGEEFYNNSWFGSRKVTKEETTPPPVTPVEKPAADPVLDKAEEMLDDIVPVEKALKKLSEEADKGLPPAVALEDLLSDAKLPPLEVNLIPVPATTKEKVATVSQGKMERFMASASQTYNSIGKSIKEFVSSGKPVEKEKGEVQMEEAPVDFVVRQEEPASSRKDKEKVVAKKQSSWGSVSGLWNSTVGSWSKKEKPVVSTLNINTDPADNILVNPANPMDEFLL